MKIPAALLGATAAEQPLGTGWSEPPGRDKPSNHPVTNRSLGKECKRLEQPSGSKEGWYKYCKMKDVSVNIYSFRSC